jgi:hypothetical protein
MSKLVAEMARRAREPHAAWALHAGALALHVADEAANDFLAVYNPVVLRLREWVPLLPLPTFTFSVWLGGLIAGIALLFAVTPAAAKRSPWLRIVALPFSVLMIFNAVGHFAGSAAMSSIMPGAYSSPVLLVAAVNLHVSARTTWK